MNHAAATLRRRLQAPGPLMIVGAHSALSARLIGEAGFDGVWASGFEISASRGVPDANILTMAEHLEAARQMAEATELPVIADCDNGFGNAVNVVRTVEEFERAGIAGICIEDNVFPKRCSFYAGVRRELATTEEHAGKIRAAIEARKSDDFCVIARTEALIAGWGLEEALQRAEAYAEAGADLVLIHSKSKTFDEIKSFTDRWSGRVPLVAVPTTYSGTTASELHDNGVKVVIFANHGIRSSIKAMQETFAELQREQRPAAVEERVVPLQEVYRLIGVNRLREQEQSYLPVGAEAVRAVILAAGRDQQLQPLTEDRPKCMLDVKGRTILDRQVEILNSLGIKDIAVVRGWQKASVDLPNLAYYDNDEFETTGEAASLFAASEHLTGRVVVLYGDILFERHVLEKLLRSTAAVSAVVDRSWTEHRGEAGTPNPPDLVRLNAPADDHVRHMTLDGAPTIQQIGRGIDAQQADAEFIGMLMLSPEATDVVRGMQRRISELGTAPFREADSARRAALTDVLTELIGDSLDVAAIEIYKGWMEVDSFEDYRRMWAKTEG